MMSSTSAPLKCSCYVRNAPFVNAGPLGTLENKDLDGVFIKPCGKLAPLTRLGTRRGESHGIAVLPFNGSSEEA